jgi:hypothetical protein
VPAFVDGAALLLGVLLVTAGVMKLARPRAFEHAVHRLLPGKREWETTVSVLAPGVVGGVELAIGTGLAGAAWWTAGVRDAALVAGATLFLGFCGVVVVAIRKGEGCGCWSSFSDGRAGGSELARAAVLAAVACVVAVVGLATGDHKGFPPAAAAWTAGLALLTAGAAIAGSRLPVGHQLDPGAPALRGPVRARAGRTASFLLGRVTSTKSALALPRLTRLGAKERQRWTSTARATRTVAALDEWLAERGHHLDWDAVTAKRMTMRTPRGRVRQVLLEPELGPGVQLTIALSLRAGASPEPVVVGSVEGSRLVIAGGAVTLHAPIRPPAGRA